MTVAARPRACAPAPGCQAGQSLVAMMVGLLISLLTIGAMLALYKSLIEVSGNASRSALRDGQVASALLAAQVELQEAGFGIPLEEPLESKFAVSADGKQVVWRFKPELGGGDACAGLRLVDAAAATPGRGLYRLPPKPCTSVAGLDWSVAELEPVASEAAFFEPLHKDGTAFEGADREVGALSLRAQAGAYRFIAAADGCLPYMQQDAAQPVPGQRLWLRATTSDVLFSACLPNLGHVPAS